MEELDIAPLPWALDLRAHTLGELGVAWSGLSLPLRSGWEPSSGI